MRDEEMEPDSASEPAVESRKRKPLLGWDKHSARSSILGIVAGLLMSAAGGGLLYLASGDDDLALGVAFFVLLPTATGFATGMIGKPGDAKWPGLLVCALIVFGSLISLQLEGLLCVLMAIPVVAPGLFAGALLCKVVRKKNKSSGARLLSLGGMLVALPLVQAVETRLTLPSSDHDVLTSATFEASADELWSAVQALDSLEAERPLLMELGLPVPTHCTLSGEAEGSERICYFDQGFIRQRVTHWEPPRRMVLRIEETDLGGRYWLGFAEAEYRLSETQGVTQITRRTTISSALRPRAYWQRIEGWMVDTEHEFLFAELRRRFSPRE